MVADNSVDKWVTDTKLSVSIQSRSNGVDYFGGYSQDTADGIQVNIEDFEGLEGFFGGASGTRPSQESLAEQLAQHHQLDPQKIPELSVSNFDGGSEVLASGTVQALAQHPLKIPELLVNNYYKSTTENCKPPFFHHASVYGNSKIREGASPDRAEEFVKKHIGRPLPPLPSSPSNFVLADPELVNNQARLRWLCGECNNDLVDPNRAPGLHMPRAHRYICTKCKEAPQSSTLNRGEVRVLSTEESMMVVKDLSLMQNVSRRHSELDVAFKKVTEYNVEIRKHCEILAHAFAGNAKVCKKCLSRLGRISGHRSCTESLCPCWEKPKKKKAQQQKTQQEGGAMRRPRHRK